MPIYEYTCETCENQFEKFVQKMDDSPVACPFCGQDATKTISKPSPFVWGKGGGWS